MDDHTEDSKKSPIYVKFQLLVIRIESYLENFIKTTLIATQTKEGSWIS